ncbi:MAG: UDP-N-acetylglucosamine 1-carboxyvinyltransferase [Candidatus Moranbacteria bacterium]|nr:UDP-N-acetylglucosamine 1-carboxyvinyltransferase [Candidatus Moranbacteria bacterium]
MNDRFIINGGQIQSGEIQVQGAKNFALKALAATLLTDQSCQIDKLPEIYDVRVLLDLLKKLGKKISYHKQNCVIDQEKSDLVKIDKDLAHKVRASVVFAGPILAKYGQVILPHPGGDVIGRRPIDFFTKGFEKMGAQAKSEQGDFVIQAPAGLKAAEIFFPKISVTATEALALAAVLAKGTTILKNCSIEPEVTQLLNHLVKMGAQIQGIGTSTLSIKGVSKLKGVKFTMMPDRLEAGTFIMMALMNKINLKVKNCQPEHLEAVLEYLTRAGAKFKIGSNSVEVLRLKKPLQATGIQTHEYPGFATDLQPIYTLLMTQAQGLAMIHEPIFEGRLFFTDALNRMGADIIMCDPHRVLVAGPSQLRPKNIESPDIRAGMTLLLAAILAQGQSVIENAQIIDRGYEKIEQRLQAIGVDIHRVN